MRRAVSAFGSIGLLVGCAARAPQALPPGSNEPVTPPREFAPPDKSFRITFPSAWLESVSKSVGTAGAEVGARVRVTRGAEKDLYEATYMDLADLDLVASVNTVVDGLAKQGSIRFDTRHPVASGSLAGAEIDLRASNHVERWRYFEVGNRLFTVGVSTTDRELPKAASRFLESFAVTGGVPRRIRSLPAGMDVRLPSDDWQLGAKSADDTGCDASVYARTARDATTAEAPAPLFRVCALRLPPNATLAGFEASQAERDHYVRDALFAHGNDWPLGFADAVGFRAHIDGSKRKRAFVFYTVQGRVGITLAIEAADSEFSRLEPEFRELLGSVRLAAPRAEH